MGDGISDTLLCSAAQGELRFAVGGRELGSLLMATVASPLHGTENIAAGSPAGELPDAAPARNWSYSFARHGMTLKVHAEPVARGVALAVVVTLSEAAMLTALRVEFALPEHLHLFHTGDTRIPLRPIAAAGDTVCYVTTHEVRPLRLASYSDPEDRLFRLRADCPYHTVSVRLRPTGEPARHRPVIRVDRLGDEYGYPWLPAGDHVVFSGSLCHGPRYRPRLYYPRPLFSEGPLRSVLLAGLAAPERLAWTAANLARQLPLVMADGKVDLPRLVRWLPADERPESLPSALAPVTGGNLLRLVAHVYRLRVDALVFMVDNAGQALTRGQKIAYWLVAGRCVVLKYDRAGNAVFLLRGYGEIIRNKLNILRKSVRRQVVLLGLTLAALAGAVFAVPALLLRAGFAARTGKTA